jgi:hypothetical protein
MHNFKLERMRTTRHLLLRDGSSTSALSLGYESGPYLLASCILLTSCSFHPLHHTSSQASSKQQSNRANHEELSANRVSQTGPGTQTLRNIPPNMFQNQQNTNRGAPLGTNRLQNGKMGEECCSYI